MCLLFNFNCPPVFGLQHLIGQLFILFLVERNFILRGFELFLFLFAIGTFCRRGRCAWFFNGRLSRQAWIGVFVSVQDLVNYFQFSHDVGQISSDSCSSVFCKRATAVVLQENWIIETLVYRLPFVSCPIFPFACTNDWYETQRLPKRHNNARSKQNCWMLNIKT